MRHYFGYDINGELRTLETYGPAGWPSDQCMEDPTCSHPGIESLRASRSKSSPEVIGWVLFDCLCDAAGGDLVKDCQCFNTKFSENYVNTQTKTLALKPQRTVLIDDVAVSSLEIITRDPGTDVVLKIASEGMADGAVVRCSQLGMVDLTLDDEWDLTIMNGVTDTKTLTAPAQGTRGVVSISGPRVQPLTFFVRGFATL